MYKLELKKKIIIFSFCLSIIFTSLIFIKFDKTSYSKSNIPYNELIKGDSDYYFFKAEIFKKNIESDNAIDVAGEYTASVLYPVLLGFYYNSLNENIFQTPPKLTISGELVNDNRVVSLTNIKLFFLFIQTTIYYLSVFFLISRLKNILNNNILNFLTLFLVFEPTIFQFNSLFMTESLYLAFINFLVGILIQPQIKFYNNFFLGIFLGILYLLKTTSIFLILPISLYYFFVNKKKSYLVVLNILAGYILVLILLGYSNYQRSGIFYLQPTQSMDQPYNYMAHIIDARSKNISEKEAYKIKIENEIKWINKNQIDLSFETNRIKLAKYKYNYAKEIILDNPIIVTKYIIWKSFQFLIIDPAHIYKYLKINFTDKDYWKIPENNVLLIIDIIYSLIFYIIILLGFLSSFKYLEKKIIFLILGLMFYHFLLLGWTGGSRYNLPLVCLSSIYFSLGLNVILKNILPKYSIN